MNHRGFAATPTPLLWILAVLFGLPALYEVVTKLAAAPLVDVLMNVSGVAVGVFMLYCALKARQGKRAELESSRTTMVGYVFLGLFIACFLVKVTSAAVEIYA
jgi:hypothetical protein